MGLRLYYVESVAPFLDEILQTLVTPHLSFKLQDSFRILCPDPPTVEDVETALLQYPGTGQVLIGRSLVTLDQFFRDLTATHPSPRPTAGPAALTKALRLAWRQEGGYQNLEWPTQRQYLTEFRRLQHLSRIGCYSRPPIAALPPLMQSWKKIIEEKWGLWTREKIQQEACNLLRVGKSSELSGLQEVFFLGFNQVDGLLYEMVEAFHHGLPGVKFHLFLPGPDGGIDPQGWLAPLYQGLEKMAESTVQYQKLSPPALKGISYPTPLHEAHALAEFFHGSAESVLGFHGHGASAFYLTELLNGRTESPFPFLPAAFHPSGVPSELLKKALVQKDPMEEVYFKQIHEELFPTFTQTRLDLAGGGQGLPLLHLESAFAVLAERAEWEAYHEELRPRRDWLSELEEEFKEILLQEQGPRLQTLPLRSYSQPGLKRSVHSRLFELNEGIFPKARGFPLLPALSVDPLADHEGFLKLKAILYMTENSAEFSCVDQDMDGRIQPPSPLWELFIETAPEKKAKAPSLQPTGRHPYFDENFQRETRRMHHPEGMLDRGDLGSLKLRTLLEETLKNNPLSATYLDDYAKCPWKFFARRHLKLEEPVDFILEIEPKFKGRIHHSLLEKIYRSLIKNSFSIGKIPNAEQREEALNQSLQSCLEEWRKDEEFQQLPPRLQQEETQRLLSRVRRFLQLEAEAWEKAQIPLFPHQLEWRFGKDPHPAVSFTLQDGRRIPLAGAVDRVDYNPGTGEYLLIDYKASAGDDFARQIRQGLSYQLFLYLFAVGQSLFPQGKRLGALYGDLKKIKKNQGMARRDGLKPFGWGRANNKSFLEDEEFSVLEKKLNLELEEILQKLLEGNFSLEPKDCQGERCPYHEICRYDHQPK